MKTKKRNLTFIMVLVLGMTLLVAASAAAATGQEDYETFKDVLQNMDFEKEANSGKVKVTVTDNGEEIFSLDASGLGNRDSENFSADALVKSLEDEKVLEIYGVDGKVYMVDVTEGGYYTFDEESERPNPYEERDMDHMGMTGVEEELLDYFVGDLKDNFEVTDVSDGGKIMSFSMEESEVPTGLALMIKAAAAADHRMEDEEDGLEEMPIFAGFECSDRAELVEDVQLKAFDVAMTLDALETVEAFDLQITVTGYDVDGQFHDMTVSVQAVLGYEEAAFETIDVESHDWTLIESKHDR